MTKTNDTKASMPKIKNEKLHNKITLLEETNSQLRDNLSRSLADYLNLEKRVESQRQLFVTLATTSIITKMADVLDDLRLAQTHLKDVGLQMTLDKFLSVLKTEGLDEISPDGQEFDPVSMECIEVGDGPENQVVATKKNGYILNGHVIRPAQVVVGQSKTDIN